MPETLQLVCPHCNAIHRAEASRLNEGPVCEKCKQPIFTGHYLELTDQNFEAQTTQSDLPVLIDFWAPWCAPCRMMSPVIDQAAQELQFKLRVGKVNTDEHGALAGNFGIRGIPTLIVLDHGREIARQSGAVNYATLLAWLQSVVPTLAQA